MPTCSNARRNCSSVPSTSPRPCRGSSSPWARSRIGSWSPGRRGRRESRVHALLFEVELALEASHDVVVDRALGTKAQKRLALRVDDGAPDLAVLDPLSILPVGRGIALPLDVLGTVPIHVPQPIEQRAVPRPDLVELIDPPRGGLDELLPGAGLFVADLDVGAESKRANEPRQRQPLAHE